MFRLLIVLTVLATTITGRKLFFQAGNCTPGTDYFSYFKMFIKNNAINMDMVIIKPLVAGMMGHLDFEVRTASSNRFQRLFQHDLNYCNMLRSVKKTIFKRWFETVLKHGNFSPVCPVPSGTYYLYDWLISTDMIPSYLSIPGEYRVKGRAYYRKTKTKREDLVLECVTFASFK